MFALIKGENDKYELRSALDDESVKCELLADQLPSSMNCSRTNLPGIFHRLKKCVLLTKDRMRSDSIAEWSFDVWRHDLLIVIRRLLCYGQKAMLIGYDIGVWLAMLAAIRCPDMVPVCFIDHVTITDLFDRRSFVECRLVYTIL